MQCFTLATSRFKHYGGCEVRREALRSAVAIIRLAWGLERSRDYSARQTTHLRRISRPPLSLIRTMYICTMNLLTHLAVLPVYFQYPDFSELKRPRLCSFL